MRVITQNLFGNGADWPARRAVLVDGLRALPPDLVAFQEAIVNSTSDQVVDLLGPEFHVAHQTERGANGSGSSIASRWPLGEVRDVELHATPRTADFACGALFAEVLAPEPIGPFLVVNHLPSWQLHFEHERELQTVVTAKAVEGLVAARGRHVVLAGDFDADPEATSVRFWSGRQSLGGMSVCYRDAWERAHPGEPGDTFTCSNPLVTDWDWPFRRLTTSSCAAASMVARLSPSQRASVSSTHHKTACGRVTISASLRISTYRRGDPGLRGRRRCRARGLGTRGRRRAAGRERATRYP